MPTQIGRNMYTAVNERIIAVHSKDKDGNGVKVGCSIDTDIVWLKEPDVQDEVMGKLDSMLNRLELQAEFLRLIEANGRGERLPDPEALEDIISKFEGYEKEMSIVLDGIDAIMASINNRNREILMKSTVTINQDGKDHTFTGYAHEKEVPFDPSKRNQDVNTTSFIENCETSSRGRALGAAGIGIEDAVASADEVRNAQAQGKGGETRPVPRPQSHKTLEDLHSRVFALFRKNQESLESQGIDYWGSVKVIFGVTSRAEMTASQWEKLLAMTQDTQNWSKHFIVKLEPDTEEPDPKESDTELSDAPTDAPEEPQF